MCGCANRADYCFGSPGCDGVLDLERSLPCGCCAVWVARHHVDTRNRGEKRTNLPLKLKLIRRNRLATRPEINFDIEIGSIVQPVIKHGRDTTNFPKDESLTCGSYRLCWKLQFVVPPWLAWKLYSLESISGDCGTGSCSSIQRTAAHKTT